LRTGCGNRRFRGKEWWGNIVFDVTKYTHIAC